MSTKSSWDFVAHFRVAAGICLFFFFLQLLYFSPSECSEMVTTKSNNLLCPLAVQFNQYPVLLLQLAPACPKEADDSSPLGDETWFHIDITHQVHCLNPQIVHVFVDFSSKYKSHLRQIT